MWMLISPSRNYGVTRNKNLLEPSALVLSVFTAINKRDALKATFMRLGGFVCLFLLFSLDGGGRGEETGTQKTSLEVSGITQH